MLFIQKIIIMISVLSIMYNFFKIGSTRYILYQLRADMTDDKRDFSDYMAQVGGNSFYLTPFPDIDPVYSDEQAVLKKQLNKYVLFFWLSWVPMIIGVAVIHYFYPNLVFKKLEYTIGIFRFSF